MREDDVKALAKLGYSAPLISEITGLPFISVKRILEKYGKRKVTQKQEEEEDVFTLADDIVLESQRGVSRRVKCWKTPIPYADEPSTHSGDIKLFKPDQNGELVLVKVIPYESTLDNSRRLRNALARRY